MSNETKIAILAIVATLLSFWGYKFIRGKNVLATSNIYYVEYDNIDQAKISTPVLIDGFRVGIIADIYLKPENYDIIVVKLDLRKDIRIPKNTVARIKSVGFMGDKAVDLIFDEMCSGPDCAKSGDSIKGETVGMLGSMLSKEDAEDYVDILKTGLQDMLDSLNKELLSENSDSPIAKSMRDLQYSLANLRSSTGQLDNLLRQSSGNIDESLENLASITGNLKTSNDQIKTIIGNAEKVSSQLSESDLKKMLEEVDGAVTQLKTTLESADKAVSGVSATLSKVNNGEGTLGKLLDDEGLYYDLSNLSARADSVLTDFQERPYRYMPLKSRRKVKKFDRLDAREMEQKETLGIKE